MSGLTEPGLQACHFFIKTDLIITFFDGFKIGNKNNLIYPNSEGSQIPARIKAGIFWISSPGDRVKKDKKSEGN